MIRKLYGDDIATAIIDTRQFFQVISDLHNRVPFAPFVSQLIGIDEIVITCGNKLLMHTERIQYLIIALPLGRK